MAKIIKNSLGNFLVICLIFALVTGWIFSGWPQIWQNPPFPPEIQQAFAAVNFHAFAVSNQTNGTTGFTITIPATIAAGEDLYILLSSRDHTAATALATVTDNDTGGNTWTREGGSTDRKLNVYWKKATSGTASKTITIAGCVGSCAGGMSTFTGGFSGDPTTNFVVEDNASADETHAGFTPNNANSFIVFGITNPNDDTSYVVTLLNSVNLGTLEPEQWAKGSTGGSDTYAIMTGIAQVGAAAATGNFTWAQTDSTTKSVSFAIKPIVVPTVSTQTANPIGDTTATCNGTITVTGGANSTNAGCEWDINSGVPYANTASTAGDYGVVSFTQALTSLPAGTTIYARAFATNSAGTGYGGEVNFLTKPAAPTSVAATDGTYTDKVTITWTKSTGASGYRVYEGSNLLQTLGDVATYDDSAAAAPTITAGSTVASDGTSTSQVDLSLSGTSFNNGSSRTYKVVAFNNTGDSVDSATNAGYRGYGTPTYQWQRSASTTDADYSNIDGATNSTYGDTGAPAPTVTPGTASATDGSANDKVTLSISGESANVGEVRYYKCNLTATGASPQTSTANDGYRDVGSLTYLWYRSSGTGDSGFSTLSGATTDPYDDTTAPAPTITAGAADASDGTSMVHVALSVSGQSTSVGESRYYYAAVSATGASPQDTNHNSGYRSVGSLTYQWQRSSGDSNADYSDISGANTASYNDTGAPSDGSGRYYKCVENATGADPQISDYNRGYRAAAVYSVSVSPGSTNYGTMAINQVRKADTSNAYDEFIVTNTGNVPADFDIISSNAIGGVGWTLSTTAVGSSIFMHAYSTDKTLSASFTLGSVGQQATNWVAMDNDPNYRALATNVDVNGTVDLVLELLSPNEMGNYGISKNITVTIVASAPD